MRKNMIANMSAPFLPPVAPDDCRQAIGDPPLMPSEVEPQMQRKAQKASPPAMATSKPKPSA